MPGPTYSTPGPLPAKLSHLLKATMLIYPLLKYTTICYITRKLLANLSATAKLSRRVDELEARTTVNTAQNTSDSNDISMLLEMLGHEEGGSEGEGEGVRGKLDQLARRVAKLEQKIEMLGS